MFFTMRERLTAVLMSLIVALGACAAEAGRPSVGLVLSGGGAKGIAHIGVIQAFEENGIPIDYITGTSMGAIVGGLYASGYTPAEMIELVASPGFNDWSKGKIDPDYIYYFLQEAENPSFVTFNLGKDSTSVKSVLPNSLINPIPMNMAFPEIFSRYTAQCGGDFSRLFVPFSCVTSDVYAKHKVVLSKGSLADAVRMSMSFPMVFEPIRLDGIPMYDGGIYDNYPVDVMMEKYRPDVVVGVNVSSGKNSPDSRNPLDQMEAMVMQPNNYPFPTDKGVNIRVNVSEFGLLDFGKYNEIYAVGYRRGLEMVDSVKRFTGKGVVPESVMERRLAFKAATPEMLISKVEVTGGSPRENAYLQSLFMPAKGHKTMTFDEARDAYYRAISSGRLQNLVPTPVLNADGTFTLKYRAVVKEDFSVGVGGYISSSTTSMLFFHLGYNPLRFKGLTANVSAWLGQSYLGTEVSGAFYYNTHRPTAMRLRFVATRRSYHETERLFYEVNAPDFIRRSEVFGEMYFSMGPSLRTRLDAGVGYGHLKDTYYEKIQDRSAGRDKERGIFNLGKVMARWQMNTLDNTMAPTSGSDLSAILQGVAGRYHYTSPDAERTPHSKNLSWLQADLRAAHYFGLGKYFALGTGGRVLLSTRKLLPTYEASIVAAQATHPTPATYNYFNPSLRANSFVALDLQPVWKVSGTFQVRADLHGFLPMRKILPRHDSPGARYGKWFHDPEFFGELRGMVTLPFGVISAYGNYATGGSGWNCGISIGAFILAPKFLE